mmetsp:Transcript_103337/g.277802  ORF Transcript_103337/g.277802 Transcript_103337/m.277802 type:complete len:221 (+) Transcript_103337:501-1163(+)
MLGHPWVQHVRLGRAALCLHRLCHPGRLAAGRVHARCHRRVGPHRQRLPAGPAQLHLLRGARLPGGARRRHHRHVGPRDPGRHCHVVAVPDPERVHRGLPQHHHRAGDQGDLRRRLHDHRHGQGRRSGLLLLRGVPRHHPEAAVARVHGDAQRGVLLVVHEDCPSVRAGHDLREDAGGRELALPGRAARSTGGEEGRGDASGAEERVRRPRRPAADGPRV